MKQLFSTLVLAVSLTATLPAQAFDVGDVFASTGSGQVKVFSSTGTLKATLDTGLGGFTTGSTFDAAGNFYVTAFSANVVSKFDANGTLVNARWATGINRVESIVFDAAGNAYLGNAGSTSIQKVDANGNQIATYATLQNTDWIDLAADQKTMLYSNEGNQMRLWDLATNTDAGVFANGNGPFFAKRYRPNGDVLVASGTGNVFRYDGGGTLQQTYNVGTSVFALNLDPDGTSFWTGATGGSTVYRYDIASGSLLTSWSTGGGQGLYGLSVLGEIQAGGGGVKPPVPEPSTYAMMALGLGLLAFMRRRNQAS